MINHPLNQKDFFKKVFDIKIQSASTHEKKKLCHGYIHRPLAAIPRGFLVYRRPTIVIQPAIGKVEVAYWHFLLKRIHSHIKKEK